MFRKSSLASLLVFWIPVVALADIDSGPAVGTVIQSLKVEVVTGEKAGQELDYFVEREAKPTIYVFVHAERFDRPVGRYLKKLDEAVKAHDGKASVIAVWLTDDKEAAKTRLKAVQNSLQFGATTLAVYPSLKDLPDGWGLNADAHLTAVVVGDKKVTADFAYVSVNETAVREVAVELAKIVK